MTDDYTPTTEQVRYSYVYDVAAERGPEYMVEEFDRWLAQHDAELLSPVRAVIDDLDTARAEGRIYTYGQIQRAMRAALPDAN